MWQVYEIQTGSPGDDNTAAQEQEKRDGRLRGKEYKEQDQ